MDSKEIIVELIVIGFGFFVLVALTGYYLDKQTLALLVGFPPVLSVFSITIFCYVFGIVVDRVADWVFSFPEDYVRNKNATDGVSFKDARSEIFSRAPHVKEWVEYGRIRIRVVRGWSINLAAITLLIVWSHFANGRNSFLGEQQSVVSVAVTIMLFGCVYSWFSLTKGECKRIFQEYYRMRKSNKT